jgi:thioredoxin reductase (NADPH)
VSPVHFTLYSRSYCHLCHDMIAALESARATRDFRFEVVDVEDSPDLEARFGLKVPLLMAGEHEIFHYHYQEALLDAALQLGSEDRAARTA